MYIQTEKELKTAASALRRELSALFPELKLGHAKALEVLAKTLGASSLAEVQASLKRTGARRAPEAISVASAPSLYPLSNRDGRYDLAPCGERASIRNAKTFGEMEGTVERIPGIASVVECERSADGRMTVYYAGETDVDWDGQRTVRVDDEELWEDVAGRRIGAGATLLVPEDFDDLNTSERYSKLKVREDLVQAYLTLARDKDICVPLAREMAHGITPVLWQSLLEQVGFELHIGEFHRLSELLAQEPDAKP